MQAPQIGYPARSTALPAILCQLQRSFPLFAWYRIGCTVNGTGESVNCGTADKAGVGGAVVAFGKPPMTGVNVTVGVHVAVNVAVGVDVAVGSGVSVAGNGV